MDIDCLPETYPALGTCSEAHPSSSGGQPVGDYDDRDDPVWTPSHAGQSGSAHAVSSDSAPDILAELHQAVADVTGKPVERPATRIGFV